MTNISQNPKAEKTKIDVNSGWRVTEKSALPFNAQNISVRDTLIAMKKAVEIIRWKKFTDKKVFLAHILKASEHYKLTYDVSVRELAEIAYVTKETACKCNKRLENQGLLFVSKKHEIGTINSNEYTLTPFMRKTIFDTHILMCIENAFSHNSTDAVHFGAVDSAIFDQPDADFAFNISRNDCFRNGVSWVCDDSGEIIALVKRLGGRCPEIFVELLHWQLQSVGELADRIGCHVTVARYALKKLMYHHLVERVKMKRSIDAQRKWIYIAPTNYDLHAVEIATHTFDRISKVKKKHKAERDGYYDGLSDDNARDRENERLRKQLKEMRLKMKQYSERKKKRKLQMDKLKGR